MLTQESMQTHNGIDEKQSMQYVHVHIKQRHEIYTHNKKSRRAKKWRATRRPKTGGRQLTLTVTLTLQTLNHTVFTTFALAMRR